MSPYFRTLLGASYREDVGDTRYSGSEIVVRKLTEMGGEIVIHDPYVKRRYGGASPGLSGKGIEIIGSCPPFPDVKRKT